MVNTRASTAAAAKVAQKNKKNKKGENNQNKTEEKILQSSLPEVKDTELEESSFPVSSEVEKREERELEETIAKVDKSISSEIANETKMTAQASTKSFEYEFGGPLGSFCVIILLPLVIYGLYFACNKNYCLTYENMVNFDSDVFVASLPEVNDLLNDRSSFAILCWMVFHILLERVLPGEMVLGAKLSNGASLPYWLSGHLQFWITLLVLCIGNIDYSYNNKENSLVINSLGRLPLEFIYDEYLTLITASLVFSSLLSIFVYAHSFLPGSLLAVGGKSGNVIYDFFIGRELNPRIGTFDIKEFCELRPGLIGWMVINIGMALKQKQQSGCISLSMILINVFQGFYVWDALHAEKSILSTMDITTDGFGFMLAFGDLAWVPFIYSLQARYLVDYDPNLDLTTIAAILLLQGLGYYIFRSANSEKDLFRRNPLDPGVRHLTYLETKRGTRLITSGWWGMARKINYTGDWIMTFSWCLLCGWQSPVPYFQAIYFLILLVHRAIRDDKMCHEKYGDDWLEYKRRVPYIFIPHVV